MYFTETHTAEYGCDSITGYLATGYKINKKQKLKSLQRRVRSRYITQLKLQK